MAACVGAGELDVDSGKDEDVDGEEGVYDSDINEQVFGSEVACRRTSKVVSSANFASSILCVGMIRVDIE